MDIVTSVFKIKVGNPSYNADKIIEICEKEQGDVYLFPAYALTGVSCGSFASMRGFKEKLDAALDKLCQYTEKNKKTIVTSSQVYGNFVIFDGDLDNKGEFTREGKKIVISKTGSDAAKADIILIPTAMPGYPCIKNDIIEFCAQASLNGKNTVAVANAGFGESSADDVFKGFCGVFRNGVTTAFMAQDNPETVVARAADTKSDGIVYARPKVMADKIPYYGKNAPERFLSELYLMQIQALYTRIDGCGLDKICVNVSGGLDSTLALLVAAETVKMAGLPLENVIALSLPGFGTSERTDKNAKALISALGVTCKTIDIKDAVKAHLAQIGHDGSEDVTYENAQSRERAQILFDVANMNKALALGTGDMSESALGWCTFGGDTLSHYNVNASVPKTVVRELVKYVAQNSSEDLKAILLDIAETPISPELVEGQKTEDIIGPYDLHDFFMYYFAKGKFTKEEVRHYTLATFEEYTDDEIDKWLNVFFDRFARSGFKRAAASEGANLLGFRLPYFPADMKLYF